MSLQTGSKVILEDVTVPVHGNVTVPVLEECDSTGAWECDSTGAWGMSQYWCLGM